MSSTAATTLEFCLLSLMQMKPSSGYDLRKVMTGSPMVHFSDSPGSIYPALRRLQSRGWIAPSPVSAEGGRSKTIYTLTPIGAEQQRQWLQRPVVRDDIIWHLPELLMRFAVIDKVFDSSRSISYLNELQAMLEAYIEEFHGYLEKYGGKMTINARLALEHGLMSYEATRLWIHRALNRLGGGSNGPSAMD